MDNLPVHNQRFPREITAEEKRQIAETFHNADVEKKGFLTNEDLKVAFVALFGFKPTKREVEHLMEASRAKGLPGMPLDTFLEIAKTKVLAQDSDDDIRQMFIAFDTKCCGFITLDAAKKVFLQVAPFLDAMTIEKIFREADLNRDGRVSYRDFEFIMKYRID